MLLNWLFASDDIGALLQQAKDAVEAANKAVNNDTAHLRAINKKLDMMKIPSGGDSNVDNILNGVNKTCEIFQKYRNIKYI